MKCHSQKGRGIRIEEGSDRASVESDACLPAEKLTRMPRPCACDDRARGVVHNQSNYIIRMEEAWPWVPG